MEIHRNPEMWGERVTPKWSQDSQGATATTSKAAPPARPPQWPPGLPVPPKAPAASSATAGVATGKTTGPAVLAGVDGARDCVGFFDDLYMSLDRAKSSSGVDVFFPRHDMI